MQFLSMIKCKFLIGLDAEKTSALLPDSDILALESLLALRVVTKGARGELLLEGAEELTVGISVFGVCVFANGLLQRQTESPSHTVRWSLYLDN